MIKFRPSCQDPSDNLEYRSSAARRTTSSRRAEEKSQEGGYPSAVSSATSRGLDNVSTTWRKVSNPQIPMNLSANSKGIHTQKTNNQKTKNQKNTTSILPIRS